MAVLSGLGRRRSHPSILSLTLLIEDSSCRLCSCQRRLCRHRQQVVLIAGWCSPVCEWEALSLAHATCPLLKAPPVITIDIMFCSCSVHAVYFPKAPQQSFLIHCSEFCQMMCIAGANACVHLPRNSRASRLAAAE